MVKLVCHQLYIKRVQNFFFIVSMQSLNINASNMIKEVNKLDNQLKKICIHVMGE